MIHQLQLYNLPFKKVITVEKCTYCYNDIFSNSIYKNGRILKNVVTNESFFVHEEAFKIISTTIDGNATFEELYNNKYSIEEFESFIQDLVDKQILLAK